MMKFPLFLTFSLLGWLTYPWAITQGAAPDTPAEVQTPTATQTQADPGAAKADFVLQIDDLLVPYDEFAIYVMGGEKVTVEALLDQRQGEYRLVASSGEVQDQGENRWDWTAPDEVGLHTLVVDDPESQVSNSINAFVMRPSGEIQDEKLNGYRIGSYPDKALRDNPRYNPPKGLVEVTPDNRDTLIAPHFQLDQFLTKQGGDWPRYVVLDERLLLKLEMILSAYNDFAAISDLSEADTLHIMSGFRTPYYNRKIGNVPNSRHVYGDAADIFIDVDGDGHMDDLNQDGTSDFADAQVLADMVEQMASDDPFYDALIGGLGRYGPKPHRGPFVHVDTRGYKARWDSQ